jgi:SAM-dependent methyltransferase
MRRDWDARAAKDAFYYIASWRKDWDITGFLASGEEDYERLVAPALDRVSFSPTGKHMLELGCGAGRMTRVFARHFGHVVAVDVSAQMLGRARQLLSDAANVSWIHANGADLSDTPSESVDFAFSYLVLQHLPDEKLLKGYIAELLRVLKAPGICLLQFNGMERPTMNWKGSLAWGIVDTLWTIRLPAVSRFAARLMGFDPDMAGKSWRGMATDAQSVIETVNASGGCVLEMSGERTPMAWCCARKV